MHELSLCRSIINSVKPKIAKTNYDLVSITIEIGVFSCVDESALKFNFKVLTKNTCFNGVELYCEAITALTECQSCKHRYQPIALFSQCPRCQSLETQLISGNELKIKEIEVK